MLIREIFHSWQWSKCIIWDKDEFPYSTDISKNNKFGCYSNKSLSLKYERYKRLVSLRFKKFCKQLTKKKVWVFINVCRPNMRADPSNFIEGIHDAIKEVCPNVDDNYFSTVCDWNVDKINPRVEITIIQER
jgi:hypothetical protein